MLRTACTWHSTETSRGPCRRLVGSGAMSAFDAPVRTLAATSQMLASSLVASCYYRAARTFGVGHFINRMGGHASHMAGYLSVDQPLQLSLHLVNRIYC